MFVNFVSKYFDTHTSIVHLVSHAVANPSSPADKIDKNCGTFELKNNCFYPGTGQIVSYHPHMIAKENE